MDDKMILLKKNGSISLCDVKHIAEETGKNSDVSFILIDVGMYTNEYIMIPRARFLRKFKRAELKFAYHVEVYCEGLTCSTDPRPGTIRCNNVLEFYRAVHSIQKLYAASHIMHDDFYAINYEGKLSQVDLTITIGKNTQNICIETCTDSSTMYDVKYVLETINYMVYGNASIPVIPDADDNPKSFYINTEEMYWKLGVKSSQVIAVFQESFKCWSFIPEADYDIITSIDGATITQDVYVPIRQSTIPADVEINASTISELDGTYLEVIFERDLVLWRGDKQSIIEFILNAKYIFLNSFIELQAQYGEMYEDMLLIVSYNFMKCLGPKYNFVPGFDFSINRNMIDSGVDIYNKFMKSLVKNYEKFIEGRCDEDD